MGLNQSQGQNELADSSSGSYMANSRHKDDVEEADNRMKVSETSLTEPFLPLQDSFWTLGRPVSQSCFKSCEIGLTMVSQVSEISLTRPKMGL